MSPRVLLVDDEANIRKMVGALLQSEGFETAEAPNGAAALATVEREAPDAVLLDLMMPGGPDGLETLEQLKRVAPDIPVVMMSGRASLTDAVRATKLGAFQFLEKPLTPEGVLTTLRAALELARTLAENRRLHEALGHSDPLVGVSKAMEELRALIARVAPTEVRVLVTGESGTGKELVASAIHRQSARAAKPFVCVNSAAIPKDLGESELFGHERGAFTGATERRIGRFELADGGTLLLDEVGDLGPEAQAKLLRVLETGVIERLGGEKPVTVDVRVIAATRTCCSGSTYCRFTFCRCGSDPRTSRRWCNTSRHARPPGSGARCGATPARCSCSPRMRGPGTCASWRTWWSASRFSRPAPRSPPTTWRAWYGGTALRRPPPRDGPTWSSPRRSTSSSGRSLRARCPRRTATWPMRRASSPPTAPTYTAACAGWASSHRAP